MAEQEYKRLTPARSSRFAIAYATRSSLWLGRDHLLHILTSGYTESYKRFYFRDIQAVTIRQTDHWKIWGLIYGALTAFFGLFALVAGEPTLRYVLAGIALALGLFLIIDLALGPSCVCHLRTAVQTEELSSVSRMRRARRVLARLRPLISQVQGQLAREELQARVKEFLSQTAPSAESGPTTPLQAVGDQEAPPRIIA